MDPIGLSNLASEVKKHLHTLGIQATPRVLTNADDERLANA